MGILPQTVSRLPVANHTFLGSWMVYIYQEGYSLRSTPQRDTGHTWDGALTVHAGNRMVGTGEVIKMHGPPGTVCSPSTWLPDVLRPRKGTKCTSIRVCTLAEYLRT